MSIHWYGEGVEDMDAGEARRVDAALRAAGIEGVVMPVDPDGPTGEWSVYDSAGDGRRDISAVVLVALADAYMKRDGGGPTRGFVLP